MAGFTPLFDSMLTGTLYGRWPHTGIWACLLSRASREGEIDEQPAALAAAIGVPVELLLTCIRDFMSADPESRTPDNDGRRLELLQPHRSWGWRVLNHGRYREKARKKRYDDARTESGEDAARKQAARATPDASRDVPTRPDASRDVPLSTPTPTPTPTPEAEVEGATRPGRAARSLAARLPADFSLTPERRLVAEAEKLPADRTFAKFCDYWRAASGAKARKHDWDATWRNWCRNDRDRGSGANAPAEPVRRWQPEPGDDETAEPQRVRY